MGNFGITLEERLLPAKVSLDRLADSLLQSIRVSLPAIVQAFHPGPPATVDVVITTNEYVMKNTGGDGPINLVTQSVQLPYLTGVPIQILGGGGWSITFPITVGDECVVIFMDTPLSVWLQNGGVNNNPISQRRHNLSDGVAHFGPRSKPRGLTEYSTATMQIRSDDQQTLIDFSNRGISITATNVTVNAQRVEVFGDIVDITGATQCNISASASTTIEGKNFLAHEHIGVTSGTQTSGPVL